MTKRMLIDATQAEETRVAIVSGNRLEEYDYESAIRKQLKGSIFLAKVTRVEPSLQAAFVDYGGNRHGFLPFSEIHPDYYRIPIADREELLAEAAGQQISEEPEEDLDDEDEDDIDEEDELDDDEDDEDEDDDDSESGDDKNKGRKRGRRRRRKKKVDEVGGTKDPDEEEAPRPKLKHQYKIQEVIKRRQIMLIQVNKEERGNKGAAVTTYISLPGRYCVLMPNSPRGGGVSRKISNSKDRQRMKSILGELTIPDGMSVIMRTAGVTRSKAEIKRDLDYLMRLWDTIREETMRATAPALINEESNLCKRAIRDLYTRDIDEVLVAGDDGYKTAKSFMKMLMPSHAKRVQPYKDESIPLFMRYQVESQIDEIHKPTAQLKSGGYLVINPTEALVSIDVNSGRSTKERNIEGTALKTNLEAAEEVARQLRLRDLGGLVVIDFIDMEVRKNNTAVERKLKEAMSSDRARVQIGRISPFGLMELSRQRLNPSLVEAHFETCPTCDGIGVVRTVESAALAVLRAIEEEGIRERSSEVKIEVSTEVALYLLNQKRKVIQDIEKRHDLEVFIHANEDISSSDYEMDYVKDTGDSDSDNDSSSSSSSSKSSGNNQQDNDNNKSSDDDEKSGGRRRRRRGGRNRNRNRGQDDDNNDNNKSEDNQGNNQGSGSDDNNDDEQNEGGNKKRRRRRGRRGGRRRRGAQADKSNEVSEEAENGKDSQQPDEKSSGKASDKSDDKKTDEKSEDKPKKSRAKSKKDEGKDDKKADEKSEDKPKKSRAKSKKDEGKDDKKADEKSEDKPKKSRAKSKKDEGKDDKKADEKSEDKPKKSRAKSKKEESKKDDTKKEDSNVAEFPEKEKGDSKKKAESADAEEKKKPAKKRKGWWNRLVD